MKDHEICVLLYVNIFMDKYTLLAEPVGINRRVVLVFMSTSHIKLHCYLICLRTHNAVLGIIFKEIACLNVFR